MREYMVPGYVATGPHLTSPGPCITDGMISFPFSTALDMLNAARIIVQTANIDASARLVPEEIVTDELELDRRIILLVTNQDKFCGGRLRR